MSRTWVAAALVVFAAWGSAACQTDDVPTYDPAIQGLVKLEIMPAEAALVIQASKPADLDFKAMGTFSDGTMNDISKRVQWSLGDLALGAFGADAVVNRFRSKAATSTTFSRACART